MSPSPSQHRLLLIGLLFVLFIAPFDEGAGSGLLPSTCVTVAAIILAVALVRNRLSDPARPAHSPLTIPLLLFLGIVFASTAWSIDRFVTVLGAAGVFACVVAALLLLRQFNTPAHARVVCLALVILACLLAPLGVLQAALGRGDFITDGPARAHSAFVTPNSFAGFLIVVIPMAAALALTARRRAGRIALWCATALLFAALVLSQSRGAWVAGAIAAALFLWQLGRARILIFRRRRLVVAGVIVLAGATALAIWVVRPEMARRAASVFQPHKVPTFQHRLLYWDATLEMAANALPLGIGLQTFHIDYPAHRRAELAGTLQWYAHNDYLQILVELGPLGLAALLWLLWRVGRMGRDVLRAETEPANRAVLLACCAGAGAALLHSLVDYDLYVPGVALPVFVCFGIIGAAHLRLTSPAPTVRSIGKLRPLLATAVLAAGTVAVFFALRPLAAEQLLRRSRFNAPLAVALCPISANFRTALGDTEAATYLACMGMSHVPGDAAAARESYAKAIELSPRTAAHHARLGQLLLKSAKQSPVSAETNTGLECLRLACALDRYSAPLRWQLGVACLTERLVGEGRRQLQFCLDQCRPGDRLRKAIAKALSEAAQQKDTDGANNDEVRPKQIRSVHAPRTDRRDDDQRHTCGDCRPRDDERGRPATLPHLAQPGNTREVRPLTRCVHRPPHVGCVRPGHRAFPFPERDDFTFGTLDASGLEAVLEVLRTDAGTNLIANPEITTLNNHEAKINLGETTPVAEFTTNLETGVSAVTGFIDIKTGVILAVTPQVNVEAGVIKMQVKPEISEVLGFVGQFDERPIVASRRAETTVRLRDGETLVIGGLVSEKTIETVTKVPVLGDIWLLGRLFKSKNLDKKKSCLYIFVTPMIMTDQGYRRRTDDADKRLERNGMDANPDSGAADLRKPGVPPSAGK